MNPSGTDLGARQAPMVPMAANGRQWNFSPFVGILSIGAKYFSLAIYIGSHCWFNLFYMVYEETPTNNCQWPLIATGWLNGVQKAPGHWCLTFFMGKVNKGQSRTEVLLSVGPCERRPADGAVHGDAGGAAGAAARGAPRGHRQGGPCLVPAPRLPPHPPFGRRRPCTGNGRRD
jgi:hypothetical protein